MVLRLRDDWVWDFWHVADGSVHHLFFLRAPRSLGDPDLRHWNVRIGHATSADLHHWTELPDVLAPAADPAWDDYTTWTGSVVRHESLWHLLYTGTSRSENGLIQRVGRAVSPELLVWERVGDGPVFVLDERWYETLDPGWHDQAWRDPSVHWLDGQWHALVTARLRIGPTHQRGTIGVARSTDLQHWDVGEPLTELTPFGQLEIPDICQLGDRWFLLFASAAGLGDPMSPPSPATTGTWVVPSTKGPLGPWDFARSELLIGNGWYGTKVIRTGVDGSGEPVVLAWREVDEDGSFGGWISDPMPLHVDGERLTVG